MFCILPIVDRMQRIDLRTVTHEVPPQEVITRDNVTVVSAGPYHRGLGERAAAALLADVDRDCRGEELNDHLPPG
ncbi:MAG: hypothetical protein ACR2IK_03865 [Chloroflexota bacterium]